MGHVITLDSGKEDSTAIFSCTLVDEDGAPVTAARLTGLTFWLRDHLGAIINSRDTVDILNANGGTIDSNGLLTLILEPEDMVIVGTGSFQVENHTMHILKEWDSLNPRRDWDVFVLPVENFSYVPAP